MGRAKFQRRKVKSHNKIMPGASLKGHLMAKGFNAAVARQTLEVQKKHCRLVNERTDIKSRNWANSIRIQKERCLLLDILAEVRLIIWEFCLLNLPCGHKPITVGKSQPQFDRDRHAFEGPFPFHRNKKFYA